MINLTGTPETPSSEGNWRITLVFEVAGTYDEAADTLRYSLLPDTLVPITATVALA